MCAVLPVHPPAATPGHQVGASLQAGQHRLLLYSSSASHPGPCKQSLVNISESTSIFICITRHIQIGDCLSSAMDAAHGCWACSSPYEEAVSNGAIYAHAGGYDHVCRLWDIRSSQVGIACAVQGSRLGRFSCMPCLSSAIRLH